MKTRKLTSDEIKIPLSVEDISNITANPNPGLLIDEAAARALKTGLGIRGTGTNIFVCGPSGAEREEAVLRAAEGMKTGKLCALILSENPEDSHSPLISETAPGSAEDFTGKEKASGRRVKILSSGSETPVIIERNPVPARLFGSDAADISGIEPGSLVRSSGGILLVNADDLIAEPESWKLLKRILRTGKMTIGAAASGAASGKKHAAKEYLILPEIELDLKVVMLGNESHYDHLFNTDEDFRDLFLFFAELDSVIELTPENLSDSINALRNFSLEKLGKTLTDAAALEVVKYSIASAENNMKLSTLNSELEQLITEASYLPEPETGDIITAGQMKEAVKNQADRFSLLERRIIEDIKSGEINLKVDGSETGKVNGLAVIDKGPWSFGCPGLISAMVAPGENGLVNIEHEAGLSGEIHDKWVLILEGFLRSRFAMDFPLSIFASICFEQSYSEIDGDSASSSELYALLSAIAGVPIRQDIAVTGSLSQTGEIQAVGGLREKIEGFYKACKAINFTGKQGVIIPEKNIKNIILPDEIIEEISADRFHIYPVSTVDDSMGILTGMEAGERNTRGLFPHGSLNQLIEKNLKKLAVQAKNFGN